VGVAAEFDLQVGPGTSSEITCSSLAAAVGTAVTRAPLAGILSANIQRALVDHPTIPPGLISTVDLDSVTFLLLTGPGLLAFVPAGRLPRRMPGDAPGNPR
jgi:hypothetical protein